MINTVDMNNNNNNMICNERDFKIMKLLNF